MIAACPSCHARYEIDAARLRGGKGRLRCARCRAVFAVAAGSDATALGPPPPPPATPRAPAAPAPARRERAPAGRLEVALVAMEAGPTRDLIVTLLTAERVRTLTADDGPSALESVRRTRPHLAVLAYRLGGLQGPELARAIQDDPALASVRIVLVGGPVHQGRLGAKPAAAHGVEGHVPLDATASALQATLFGVLGLNSGVVDLPDRDELARLAWIAAADARLYHPEAFRSDAASRGPNRRSTLDALIERARQGCLERHPQLRSAKGICGPFVEELERALGLRD